VSRKIWQPCYKVKITNLNLGFVRKLLPKLINKSTPAGTRTAGAPTRSWTRSPCGSRRQEGHSGPEPRVQGGKMVL
jgi:hypothetical protein